MSEIISSTTDSINFNSLELLIMNQTFQQTNELDKQQKRMQNLFQSLMENDLNFANMSMLEKLSIFREIIESGLVRTYVPLLPLILNLNTKPFVLNDHFPFEPVFQTRLTRDVVIKSGRQVAKSTSLAARGLIICNSIPAFNMLFITPLYEQIRRFSSNYVRELIEHSPVKQFWVDSTTENNVLQRTFRNQSKMFFSYAFLSADRTRGYATGSVNFDEIQDIDKNHIPIIKSTMSASPWRLTMYTGTPKTLDNTLEGLWTDSSMAEWCIHCEACNKLNIPSMDHDLDRMIGPFSEDISELKPGVICAKCGRNISPRNGRWMHRHNNKRWTFPGYHIPQIIMPMHYADPERWAELLAKQQGFGNMTTAQFYNEILGESYDYGTKLVSETDLKNAAILPWENNPRSPTVPLKQKDKYIVRVLGVDWGGGGGDGIDDMVSFTTMAVVGMLPNGKLDVIYGRRLLTPHDPIEEARQCLAVYKAFNCHLFAHDYNGAGAMREAFMIQAGIPYEQVIPIVYYRSAAKNMMTHKAASDEHYRHYWLLDKARSLSLTCQCIKYQHIRTFKYDYIGKENPGLLRDFCALVENKTEMLRGSDVYSIQRMSSFTDDFAHSVNLACNTIWHRNQKYPNLPEIAKFKITGKQQALINPDVATWDIDNFLKQP